MLLIVIPVCVVLVCVTLIYLARVLAPVPSAPANSAKEVLALVESLARASDTQLAIIEKLTVVPQPPLMDAAPAEAPEFDMAAVDYDPTDDDPFLGDPTYGGFVPRAFGNDAGPVITHPLGIPGLSTPMELHRRHAPNIEVDG
jgi:hypothetical protein